MRALLDEIRVFGNHEDLGQRIDHYLGARSVTDLYGLVLKRWEADYERERPSLVRDAMSAIWAARRGLAEAELLELLGTRGRPLPGAVWSPFFLAAEQSMVVRSGLISFSHDYLREAVRSRYIPNESAAQEFHLRLANYFESKDAGGVSSKDEEIKAEVPVAARTPSRRKVDEVPWQLCEAKSWDRLAHLLSDRTFFPEIWSAASHDVVRYWALLESSSDHRLTVAFSDVIGMFAPVGDVIGRTDAGRDPSGERALHFVSGRNPRVYRALASLVKRSGMNR